MPERLASAVRVGKYVKAHEEKSKLNKLPHLRFSTKPTVVRERPGRPTMHFVDVGVKFVDVKDQLKRDRASKRRALMREKRKGPEYVPYEPQASASETETTSTAVGHMHNWKWLHFVN